MFRFFRPFDSVFNESSNANVHRKRNFSTDSSDASWFIPHDNVQEIRFIKSAMTKDWMKTNFHAKTSVTKHGAENQKLKTERSLQLAQFN